MLLLLLLYKVIQSDWSLPESSFQYCEQFASVGGPYIWAWNYVEIALVWKLVINLPIRWSSRIKKKNMSIKATVLMLKLAYDILWHFSKKKTKKKTFKIRSLKKHQLIGLIVSQTGNLQNLSKIEISIRTSIYP